MTLVGVGQYITVLDDPPQMDYLRIKCKFCGPFFIISTILESYEQTT
jgi:hypothetical protein